MKRHFFLKWAFSPIMGIFVKDINGMGNFPDKGSFIIASNHNSSPDEVVILYVALKKGPKLVGGLTALKPYKKTFFNRLIIKLFSAFLGFFFETVSVYDKDPIVNSVNLLKKEVAFLIFPEGKQNYGNKTLLRAKKGTARIALLSKAPIVPVGIIGSEKVIPKFAFFPRFHRITMNIGKPMIFKEFYGMENNKHVLDKVTRLYMKEIAKLCGKKYPY